jgi:hypothetical protein
MLTTEVASRLERKLGLGAFPMVRRRMYQRLQRLAVQHGDPVLEIIAQVEMEAIGPKVRDKGQYFCWVVKRRLGELGFPIDLPQAAAPAVPPANTVKEVKTHLAASFGKTAAQEEEEAAMRTFRDRRRELQQRQAREDAEQGGAF